MTDFGWVKHCARPRKRPAGCEWDVFVSYRSVNRSWAVALHDMLEQAGFRVFLDQFVLVAGSGLPSQLHDNLEASAAGILIWSRATSDSSWVKGEYNAMYARAMSTEGSAFPYRFVVAQVERGKLPSVTAGSLYVDFSEYPDGPTGAELVRLTHGLVDERLDDTLVRRILEFEEDVREEPAQLRALKAARKFDEIERRALSGALPYTTLPTLAALAAEELIKGEQYTSALRVIEHARQSFRGSLRLRQLRGLALRRLKRTSDSIEALELLRQDGHRDPETLGMLAAAWADEWEARRAGTLPGHPQDALEHSRNLYRQAFERVPSDTYVGINAASKSALLRDQATAEQLAARVLERLTELKTQRGSLSEDYWERVTEPEALLILGKPDEALKLYHDARIAHQVDIGSIRSTWTQIRRLLEVLPLNEDVKRRFHDEFQSVAGAAP